MNNPEEMKDELQSQVIEILSGMLGLEEKHIQLESALIDDLGLTSMQASELILILEEEFAVKISEVEAESIVTLGELVNWIYEKNDELYT